MRHVPERVPARKPLLLVVVLLLAGAVALWFAARLTWSTAVEIRPGSGARVPVRHTGGDQVPALVPLALLALAGIAGTVAVGGWPRRVIGALLAAAGIGTVSLALIAGDASTGEPLFPWARTIAGLGGVLVFAAGAMVVRYSARMPRLGSSYQSGPARNRPKDPDSELWQALSQGEDPTTRSG
jgi:tryptophan-associated transmembrane protein